VDRDIAAVLTEIDAGTGEKNLTKAQISTIGCPVTGLVGELTLPYLKQAMERIVKLLPQTQVRVIPGGCHALHLDNPVAFAQAVHEAAECSAQPASSNRTEVSR
jgi:pimeloyl-ACP methyl ester carboxylesterase